MRRRTLVFGLDAFEPTVARALVAEGRMPALARLAERSARFELEHGPERYTGLAWHQFSTGLHPAASHRWSAIHFDPATYAIEQPDADEPPFTEALNIRTVAFDVPRFDLGADPASLGIANWGSHDAGVPRMTRPAEIWGEVGERFGAYPAPDHIYGIVWRDPAKTEEMGRALVRAVATRRRIARWLLEERLPGWDLAIVAIAEFHSVVETMWHGWDEGHPLHRAPSAGKAREALVAVYEAADGLIGELVERFPDATIVAFAPHGMGENKADATGMGLLAEVMYRHSFGAPALLDSPDQPNHEDWSAWVNSRLYFPEPQRSRRAWYRSLFRRGAADPPAGAPEHELDWMPTARYRQFWPQMKAFALPAYHDARIRLNLQGREASGVIRQADYAAALDEVAALIGATMDIATGRPIEVEIEFPHRADPLAVGPTEADIVVRLKRNTLGLMHPRLGQIGPIPHRRTGGHTGGLGIAYVAGEAIRPADHGVFSTFDLSPAIGDLVTGRPPRSPMTAVLGA